MFLGDPETEAMIMIGEIGGTDEEEAADFLKSEKKGRAKPCVGLLLAEQRLRGVEWGMLAQLSLWRQRWR